MKVTFAQIGHYSLVFKCLIEELGGQFIEPEQISQKTIEEGVKIAPETICFPCKVNLGTYLSALRRGADTIVMFDSQGQCRFRYYGLLQKKILQDYGYKVSFVIFSKRDFFNQLKSLGQVSLRQFVQACRKTWKKMKIVEEIEALARFYRPREIKEGSTERVMRECLEGLDKIKEFSYLARYKKIIKQKFHRIKIDQQREPLKVGIVGEIFTIIDSFVNQNIEVNLGRMGVEVHRHLNLSSFIKHNLFPFHKWRVKRRAKNYLKSIVGGHGLDSVAEMIDYVKKGFDGVIHLFPFGCMPEVTVRPILDKIRQEKNIPLLSLSLDEQTGQAGLQTRLEAFVDLIKSRQKL
jgi:predicted nucleotide-binding protein (sugar kinase/HSP70/actin superfamily)